MSLGLHGPEKCSEWRMHARKILGRAPTSLRVDPLKNVLGSSAPDRGMGVRHADTTHTPETNLFKDTANRIRRILAAWRDQNYSTLKALIEDWEDLFDPSMPHVMSYFVGLGGVDAFVRILCEPPRLFERNGHYNHPRGELIYTLTMVLKILTEVHICHSELSWSLYDRYPGVFFRLLELIAVPSLRQAATPMLEHLISNLGPIFEIARTPLLIKLLRSDDDGVLAGVYRIVALLVVPFLSLSNSPLRSRQILYSESMLALKRVQRVIDSNVLWLLAEPNLMDRLMRLCEVRVSGIRVLNGNYITLVTPHTVDIMNYYLEQSNPLLNVAENMLISSIEGGYFEESDEGAQSAIDNDMNSFGRALETSSATPLPQTGVTDATATASMVNNLNTSQGMIDFIQQTFEEAMQAPNAMTDDTSKVDFNWLFGVNDARHRWRLQDLTLTMEEDDTRPKLYYGGGDCNTVSRFQTENKSVIDWLAAKPPLAREANEYLKMLDLRSIVDSQSEILFVLNVMLSTFYFSDVWMKLKACRWMPRANRIYDNVFFLSETRTPFVDVAQRVEISNAFCKLPRFQPLPLKTYTNGSDGDQDGARGTSTAGSRASAFPDPYPAHWRLRPFKELLGPDRNEYLKDPSSSMLYEQDDIHDDKHHQHGPDTTRKLELIHCIREFWNAQDRHECGMLHSDDILEHARLIGEKMARTLDSCKEETCVESTLSHALEVYLRCFSFPYGVRRNAPDCPQSVLGDILLRPILERRIYNATRVPGMINSLVPLKRFESLLSLAAELLRYHFNNLRTLCLYMRDETLLTHLNDPNLTCKCAYSVFRSNNDDATNAILQNLPLERQEFEPFGCVLLRRIFRFGLESNLIVRVIVLSVTPGLRSSYNYISKGVPIGETKPAVIMATPNGHVGDILAGYPARLAYIRRVSRTYVFRINEALTGASPSVLGVESLSGHVHNPTLISELLVALLSELENAPHRLPLKDRPFPDLFNERDRRILRGQETAPTFGPPPLWKLPLFGENLSDEDGLRELRPLTDWLLAEPPKLLYSSLCYLNAEHMSNTNHLCVVTTALLLFMREAHLQRSINGINGILDRLRPLAEHGYKKWKRSVHRVKSRQNESNGRSSCERNSHLCEQCSAANLSCVSGRCSAFLTFGECYPNNEARMYYMSCGGCFYRNLFRLLCVWVGHYTACQRYLETIYFSTEIAFEEYKTVLLYLLSILPTYFFPLIDRHEGS